MLLKDNAAVLINTIATHPKDMGKLVAVATVGGLLCHTIGFKSGMKYLIEDHDVTIKPVA